jgi:hypothetical protein
LISDINLSLLTSDIDSSLRLTPRVNRNQRNGCWRAQRSIHENERTNRSRLKQCLKNSTFAALCSKA